MMILMVIFQITIWIEEFEATKQIQKHGKNRTYGRRLKESRFLKRMEIRKKQRKKISKSKSKARLEKALQVQQHHRLVQRELQLKTPPTI